MLEIYENISDFKKFCTQKVNEYFEKDVSYEDIFLNEDIFILNKDKYTVDDIGDYLEFQKYRPAEEVRKLSIINDFDNINIKIQNKLLKTYEESENHHIIIVNNQNRVLPTILSRAQRNKGMKEVSSNLENYPARYHKVVAALDTNNMDNQVIDKYLKIYDYLKDKKYEEAYIYITTAFSDYEIDLVYEIFQLLAGNNISLNDLLDLQERLFSNTQKNLQIENFLLNLIKSKGIYGYN